MPGSEKQSYVVLSIRLAPAEAEWLAKIRSGTGRSANQQLRDMIQRQMGISEAIVGAPSSAIVPESAAAMIGAAL